MHPYYDTLVESLSFTKLMLLGWILGKRELHCKSNIFGYILYYMAKKNYAS